MAGRTRTAVVGHVEWVDFVRVPRLPVAGEVIAAGEHWTEAAGGGAAAAVTLAHLGGGALFLTALGSDEMGEHSLERLRGLDVEVRAARRRQPTRRAITFVDARGERTITTLGARLQPVAADALPWERLGEMDAVFFTAGDGDALRAARHARVLVATPRAGDALDAGVELDALVLSADDTVERELAARHAPVAEVTVLTAGAAGGSYRCRDGTSGRWEPVAAPGPIVDTYGCGDAFVAGLTFGLGAGLGLDAALALAARCGAARATGQGPYGGELPDA